jgi:hypothetical protein
MIDLKKMATVRDAVNEVRGPLLFFAVFLLEDTDQWDVVVAGPRLREHDMADLRSVCDQVVRIVGADGMRDVRRVVVFDGSFQPLQPLLNDDVDYDEPLLLKDFEFGQLQIARAYIFTVHRIQSLAAAR